METKGKSNVTSSETTRRQTLKVMAGSAAATLGFPIRIGAAPQAVSHGAHAEAHQAAAAPYVLKYFSTPQAQTIDALAEVIIPADDHSPGAKAARVFEYIDEIVLSSLDAVKQLWADGLVAMNRMASDSYGQEFVKCTADQQMALMEQISRNEELPATPEEKFFVALKAATIEGYYTSKIGIHQDLEYQGNTVVINFPGCTHEAHKAG
jgi:hypothetical protein